MQILNSPGVQPPSLQLEAIKLYRLHEDFMEREEVKITSSFPWEPVNQVIPGTASPHPKVLGHHLSHWCPSHRSPHVQHQIRGQSHPSPSDDSLCFSSATSTLQYHTESKNSKWTESNYVLRSVCWGLGFQIISCANRDWSTAGS